MIVLRREFRGESIEFTNKKAIVSTMMTKIIPDIRIQNAEFTISSDIGPNKPVGTIFISDFDVAQFTLSLSDQTNFILGNNTGKYELKTSNSFNLEAGSTETLTAQIKKISDSSVISSAQIIVKVDNPTFEIQSQTFLVSQSVSDGTEVGKIQIDTCLGPIYSQRET